ncbi:MAG: GGDEF domain-containing protein [Myxococcales bacterium]
MRSSPWKHLGDGKLHDRHHRPQGGRADLHYEAHVPFPRWSVPLVCGGLICLMALFDLATGAEHHVSALYFAPVFVAAWFGSRLLWITAVVAAALAASLTYPELGTRFSSYANIYLNLATQLVAFTLVGSLTEMVRRKNLRDLWTLQHDALTGAYNTAGFRQRLELDIKYVGRFGRTLTLAYLDLDNFKAVNDSQGHRAGDDVLRLAVRLIRASLRETDLLARLGGDEFAILLPETDAEGAHVILEHIRQTLEREMHECGCNVTASIGALSLNVVPSNADSVIAMADQLMYSVKKHGKNRVVVDDRTDG